MKNEARLQAAGQDRDAKSTEKKKTPFWKGVDLYKGDKEVQPFRKSKANGFYISPWAAPPQTLTPALTHTREGHCKNASEKASQEIPKFEAARAWLSSGLLQNGN